MELTGILFLLLALILLIFFVVGLVKGYAGWGVFYTIALVFVFLPSLLFVFASAGVAHRRIGWIKVHDQMKAQVATLEAEVQRLKAGDFDQPTADLGSLLPLASEVSRLTLERGRVWRHASLTDFKPESIKVTLAPPAAQPQGVADAVDPAAAAAGAPAAAAEGSDLPVELLVYAFGEVADEAGKVLPRVYLGEYFVAESQGGTATLRPVAPLLASQLNAIKSGNVSEWTIFELMPLDSHVAFAEPNSKRSEGAEFGRMDPKSLAELLQIPESLLEQDPSSLSPEDARRQKLLRAYVADGGRAPENEAPENIWSRIEFLQDHEIDVDSDEVRTASDGGYFDSTGRAVDARLKRGKGDATPSDPSTPDPSKVRFKKGETVLFEYYYAKEKIEQNVAKLIEHVFVRPLNDYTFGFREIRERIARADQDILLINREIAQTDATNNLAQQQVVFQQNEGQLMKNDQGQYEKELAVVKAEVERLSKAVADKKQELSKLYQSAQRHYERLVRTQRALLEAASN